MVTALVVVQYTIASQHLLAFLYGRMDSMTIDAIFARYEVSVAIQQSALLRGAYVLALEEQWVGSAVTWPILVKACICASLGESSAHIRKKIGLDKYIGTLITRGQPKFAEVVAVSHDVHQKLYAYVVWQCTNAVSDIPGATWEGIVSEVEHNLVRPVVIPDVLTPQREHTLREINILHYKNPSV